MPRRIAGPCSEPGCPNRAGSCQTHRKPSARQDYGAQHQAERRAWQKLINQGGVTCRRCDKPIPPHDPTAWDLGHGWPAKAPECRCNRATMGRERA